MIFWHCFFVFTITIARFRGLEWRCFGGLSGVLAGAFRSRNARFRVPGGGVLEVSLACWRAHSALEMPDLGSQAEVFWGSFRRAGGRIPL